MINIRQTIFLISHSAKKRQIKKSLSTRTHKCSCGCELQRDVNAAINILNLAKNTVGQTGINATGLATSTLLGANLVEQVARLKVESPRQ